MTTYGVLPTGFRRKPVQAILDDIKAAQWAEISPALDLSSVTPWGQNNGIFANELGIAWEILELCYHAFDPDAAQDFLLTSLAKLSGTIRRPAGYSVVTLTVNLDNGTTLESDQHFAAVDGDSTSLWTPLEDYTATSSGDVDIVFRAENPGPIPAQSGTITVINTAVTGWNSVTNAEAADPGREIDTDAELRTRREEQLAAPGSGTIDAIRADVSKVEDVESVRVFENDSDATVDGMPPHSIEVLVFDGEVPAADDDAIAQAIWDNKVAGIETIGTSSGTAIDAEGNEQTVNFTRPTVQPVYLAFTLSLVSGGAYTEAGGATSFKEFIAEQCKAMHGVGADVKWRRIDSLAFDFGGAGNVVEDVSAFYLALTVTPVVTSNIAISPREIASFDTSRITVA